MSKDVEKDRYGRPKIRSGIPAANLGVQGQQVNSLDVFSTNLKFEEGHPDALVIQCSDGRYTSIVSELMKSNGIFRYDVMAMPGGPALLDMASASILQSEACKAGTAFLIKGHNTRKVWLLAHSSCGYYKYNLNGMPQSTIIERQTNDLQRAANWLLSVDKTLAVYATYITHENGAVSFKAIEIE